MEARLVELAEIVWNYHQVGHTPVPGDVILAMGTNDLRVATFAADLWHRGFGATLVCSGGVAHQNDLLATSWDATEAEVFAAEARRCGVPDGCIVLEPRAVNTAENIRFTRRLLQHKPPQRMVVAAKPFMQRRTMASWAYEWPEMPMTIASPDIAFVDYCSGDLTMERVTNIMLGDLQRLWVYARKGWSAPQQIPDEVSHAYDTLIAAGFDRHLIAE